MSCELRKWVFVGVAFLLGSINVLYYTTFYIFLVVSFILNITGDWKGFLQEASKYRRYLLLPILGVLYLVIHYLILLCIGEIRYKVSWSLLELLLLYFFFIPIYVVSVKSFITPRLLKHFLLGLCWGILVFNFIKFFYLTGGKFFSEPFQVLQTIYAGRFGGNMDLLKGFVLLEPQAFYLAVSAIISYFFILRSIYMQIWKTLFWSCLVIFILSLVFLSFTVTKAAILAFIVSCLFLSVVFYRKLANRQRLYFGVGFIMVILVAYILLPSSLKTRFQVMKVEIEKLQEGEFQGATVAPRIALWKEDFAHFDEWGVFGLGFYKKYGVREWYRQSQFAGIATLRNTHNSFLDFWLLGGIPGLLFICFYFFVPIWKMIRTKKYSYLLFALILALVVVNNTCLLIALSDSSPLILFILAMAFLLQDYFVKMEDDSENHSKEII